MFSTLPNPIFIILDMRNLSATGSIQTTIPVFVLSDMLPVNAYNLYFAIRKQTLSQAFVTHFVKRDLLGIAKSINPGQLAQSLQADQGRKLFAIGRFSVY